MLLSVVTNHSRSSRGGASSFVHHHPLAAGDSKTQEPGIADSGTNRRDCVCCVTSLLLASLRRVDALAVSGDDDKIALLWIVRMSHSTDLRDPTVILGRIAEFRKGLEKCEQAYIKD